MGRRWMNVMLGSALVQGACQFQSEGIGTGSAGLASSGADDAGSSTSRGLDTGDTRDGGTGEDGGEAGGSGAPEVSGGEVGEDTGFATEAVGETSGATAGGTAGDSAGETAGDSAGETSVGGSTTGDGPPTGLLDHGLLARYFLDEAGWGTAPELALDAAPDPLDLWIDYGAQLAYAVLDGHRGLEWTKAAASDLLAVPVESTKIAARLHGRNTATLELVVRVDEAGSTGSRLLHIGTQDATDLALSVTSSTRLLFHAGGEASSIAWPVDLATGRAVLHVVYDTTQAAAADRVILFANGERVTPAVSAPPPQGRPLAIDHEGWLALGNRPGSQRSFDGFLLYAALYDVALTVDEVQQNASTLQESDDSP